MQRIFFLLSISVVFASSPVTVLAAESIQFNRDVRPILADVCYHCHGPDKARRKGNLRLDLEDDAKAIRDDRAAIVPGKPEQSELIRRIMSHDSAERMPPDDSGRKLTAEQKDVLRRWIDQGANWQKHWAFIPPVRSELPSVKNHAWVRNPIDKFILARLEQLGLSPSPEAPKTTLIRRLSFDLTGLPPTPEEVDLFLRESDAKPQAAYEKLVDRLLASPRYGERMAWRWLEAARYADTHGYQTDGERDMWRWRDWVIEAYNRNLPFDQFTIEQIAGDLLTNPTLDQKIATGFNRNHRGNSEGGIVPEEYAVEYVVDRVDTTSTVWLGLTMGCARCHDHKYDPFSQKEYYQLFAYFNNVPEKGRAVKTGNSPPFIKAPTKEQEKHLDRLDSKLSEAEENWDLIYALDELPRKNWEKRVNVKRLEEWSPERGLLFHLRCDGKDKLSVRNGELRLGKGRFGRSIVFDGKSYVDAGNVGNFGFDDSFTLDFWVKPSKPIGTILSRMGEQPQSEGYCVQLVDGKLQVHMTKRWLDDALRVETIERLKIGRWNHVTISYDGSRLAAGVKVFVHDSFASTNTLLDELNQTFKTDEPFRIGAGGGENSRFEGEIESLRIYNDLLIWGERSYLGCPETIADILRIPENNRTNSQIAKLAVYFFEKAAPKDVHSAYNELRHRQSDYYGLIKAFPTVMVMQEMPEPRDAFVLLRGEYDKRGVKVSRAVPAALNRFPIGAIHNRLGLADWLVDPANPLTARVAVNRMWQLHFGIGLVKTGEDFGTQGQFPSHPELLEWLAVTFRDGGWDVKKLHKLIVMSATYRQASRVTKESLAKDPENRLLARGPRYRLSAEMVRDQALLAGGLLVEKLGGPSVKPYQPSGLWKELSGGDDYKQDKGENLYRRSLYTYWKRTVSPPSLMTFDASTREFCSVRESRTNTPLQALTLLNDVVYVEAARMLAQRVLKESKPTPEARIERAFQIVASRSPKEAEMNILRDCLKQHLAEYRANPAAARKLLRIGEAKIDPNLDVPELAAYTAIGSLILNLDEAVTKE